MDIALEVIQVRRKIARLTAVLTTAILMGASVPVWGRTATLPSAGGNIALSSQAASLNAKKSSGASVTTPAYRNGQRLNRILVKVGQYQKGAFYVKLMPQKPTTGAALLALPNLTLEKLLALAKTDQELVVSGRVSVYDGKYYFMLAPNIYQPSQFGLRTGPAMRKISRRRASQQNAATILKKLLSHSISAPASEHITIKPAAVVRLPIQDMNGSGAQSAPAVAEGTYIWNRMGHLLYEPVIRQWIFVFLSDGRRAPDAPIIILPSPQLSEMQALEVQNHSRAVLRISGIVTEFRGHNFLMPTYVQLYHNLGRF